MKQRLLISLNALAVGCCAMGAMYQFGLENMMFTFVLSAFAIANGVLWWMNMKE